MCGMLVWLHPLHYSYAWWTQTVITFRAVCTAPWYIDAIQNTKLSSIDPFILNMSWTQARNSSPGVFTESPFTLTPMFVQRQVSRRYPTSIVSRQVQKVTAQLFPSQQRLAALSPCSKVHCDWWYGGKRPGIVNFKDSWKAQQVPEGDRLPSKSSELEAPITATTHHPNTTGPIETSKFSSESVIFHYPVAQG